MLSVDLRHLPPPSGLQSLSSVQESPIGTLIIGMPDELVTLVDVEVELEDAELASLPPLPPLPLVLSLPLQPPTRLTVPVPIATKNNRIFRALIDCLRDRAKEDLRSRSPGAPTDLQAGGRILD